MIDPDIIKFTKHALLQMSKRNISREEIFAALNNPDEFKPGTHSNERIPLYARKPPLAIALDRCFFGLGAGAWRNPAPDAAPQRLERPSVSRI